MAIEIAFLSVILRNGALAHADPQRSAVVQTLFHWEREWFREDAHLAGTTFMCPADVRAFGRALEQRTGLVRGADWAVVDMLLGPISPTPWLEFRGGPGELTGVWLKGTQPGELSRVHSMLPGKTLQSGQRLEFMNAFGRDTRHDTGGHREDFGTLIPDWGGKDLWLASIAGIPGAGTGRSASDWLSLDASSVDFLGLVPAGPKPGQPLS